MASLGAEIFTRGFRFNPSPLEAVTYYLPRLLAGAPLHEAVRPVVHHADVYACEPGELARLCCPLPRTGHRFFFTHCKLHRPQRAGKASRAARAAGPGSWHSQGGVTNILDKEKVKVGEMRKLRYKKGGAFTDWLMDEYSCCLQEAVVGDLHYVFCNIYVSPRAAPDSAAKQESAAFFSPTAPAPVVITQAAAPPKRPAPQSAAPPCYKRMRGAIAPAPPVVQPTGCTTSFAQSRQCVPNHGVAPSSTPSVIQSSPASARPPTTAPTRLAARPPRSLVQPPKQQMPLTTPSVARTCHMPVQACMPQRGMAPSSTTLVARTPPPPAAAPTSLAVQSGSSHKQQMPPPPTPPVVRASHMPVQAPALPSVQRRHRMLDPFEAAQPRDEAEQERVAAPGPKESPAAEQDDDDLDDFVKFIEDNMPTCEGSMATDDEMEQELSSLLDMDDETVIVPNEEIPDEAA